MGDGELEKLHTRARREALFSGHARDADDFAQWIVLKRLEGFGKRQNLKHALIDYLRHTYGQGKTFVQKANFIPVEKIKGLSAPVPMEEAPTIRRIFDDLDDFHKKVFTYFYREGLTITQIGKRLKTSRYQVKMAHEYINKILKSQV